MNLVSIYAVINVHENRPLKVKIHDKSEEKTKCKSLLRSRCSLQREDVLLLLVAIGDVAVAVGQVE